MAEKQRTISRKVSVSGVGLHTGKPSTLTFQPAPENHGYVFQRIDLDGHPKIPALVDYVVDTSRGTTIGIQQARVHTVEHVLASLVGLQLDNVLIQLDGPEPPGMDGSSRAFTEVLQSAGVQPQEAEREYVEIDTPLHYQEKDRKVDLSIVPASNFQAEVSIDFNSDVLDTQRAILNNITDFPHQIANCRTFCFLHEVEALYEAGLIQGGSLESAVVIVDREIQESETEKLKKIFNIPEIQIQEGVLNNSGLNYENEPARHKLLDLVGDLALVGKPIKGKVIASRPGHKANVELAKKIKAKVKQNEISQKFQKGNKEGVVFDINAIHEILPHRYPFLLVDKITFFEENQIKGVKNVTINEPFFKGHFPGNPIMPGVLQLEAMAQVGGVLLLNTIENPNSVWVYIVAIDNARFKKPVIPGDTLEIEVEMTALRRSICKMSGKAYVDGNLVCSVDMVASVVPKNKT
jgi:UDP-3-O-[3-hydroxymyristoyl] N-acetylglucosamine deacetylase/3-hydroxyacyl-[acyl-carrier-protein] dehydratase